MNSRKLALAIACAPLFATTTLATTADATTPTARKDALETLVITAEHMAAPLRVETDPSRPRQPLPAHDGAEYLKTIPGFSVTRKGGTDGDPLFRGMAASRVNILLDGESLSGGCGMRMDPPTAYVFPEAFDRITVIKGPQSVVHGPGNSAATVLFERDPRRMEQAGWEARGSVTGASHSRHDEVLHVRGGTPDVYGDLTGTHARSGNYEDGDGNKVHSRYERWSVNGALGWTPDADTLVEVSGALSDGEAAYADRLMDGAEFERENLGIKLRRADLSERVRLVEAQAYYNYVDHVMDNYSVRDFMPSMTMPAPAASNPDRRTVGGRVATELAFGTTVSATIGLDHQANRHATRSTMNEPMMPYADMARVDDASFSQVGAFGEITWRLAEQDRIIGGLRIDAWKARDKRATVRVGMMGSMPNPTAGERRDDTLQSGFLRYERDLAAAPLTLFAGLGHAERFPDYWEIVADRETATSLSAFDARPETNTQLDIGLILRGERLTGSLALFYNDIEDYLLIESSVRKGMRLATTTRNVDANTVGGELGLSYALDENWRIDGTLAYTRGRNDTDDRPLAQQPPLEGRLSLNYENAQWSFGALLRLVDDQDRFALNQGNVVGQDLGATDGFTVFSLNGGYRLRDGVQLTAGVDNLFDEGYAEHVSRGGAMVAGFAQTFRVNEPGRTAWVKLSFTL